MVAKSRKFFLLAYVGNIKIHTHTHNYSDFPLGTPNLCLACTRGQHSCDREQTCNYASVVPSASPAFMNTHPQGCTSHTDTAESSHIPCLQPHHLMHFIWALIIRCPQAPIKQTEKSPGRANPSPAVRQVQ